VEINLAKLGRIVLKKTRRNGRFKKSWMQRYGSSDRNIVIDRLKSAGNVYVRAFGMNEDGLLDAQQLVDNITNDFHVSYSNYVNILPWPNANNEYCSQAGKRRILRKRLITP
jgi:hypothetical protein